MIAPTALAELARDPLLGLAWIDAIGLALVASMLLLGLLRGLWWQVIRLVGLAGSVLVARSLTPSVEPMLSGAVPELSPRVAHGVVWLVLFLAALAAATLLGRLGRKLLESMQLGAVDRAGGAFVGALTGAVLHLALLLGLSQLGKEDWVAEQVGGSHSEALLEVASTRWHVVLPAEAARELDALFRRGELRRGAPPERDASDDAGEGVH